jgi:hypothetical protein
MSDSGYHEARARYIKARRLAMHLDSRGISLTEAQGMHPALREHHAKMAGVNDPSNETWAETVSHLGSIHKIRGEQAKIKDPFEGLT